MTLWQRRRLERGRLLVSPAMRRWNEELAGPIAKESRKKGLDYAGYKRELKEALAEKQSELHKKYHTHPLPTLIGPLAVHIPLLILFSNTIRRALELPLSPMGSETFLWLSQLGQPDGSGILPVLGGMLAFANAEMASRRVRGMTKAEDGTAPHPPSSSSSRIASSSTPSTSSQEAGRSSPQVRSTTLTAEGTSAPTLQPYGSSSKPSPADHSATPSPSTENRSVSGSSQAPRRRKVDPDLVKKRKLSTSSTMLAGEEKRTVPVEHLTDVSLDEGKPNAVRDSEIRSTFVTAAMRVGAVLFIPIASQTPSVSVPRG
ncbi:hypothetical protein M231_00011 [Tremella mesenterica]|uniref:Preprotein translocase subunit YidC n=1 Tax=Tremella mesenterica TaxID=5217 RepID=A0A4V1M532_TREME|nr:hypothetical protein M231_00011 [Tremella mesenterica]